MKYVILSLLLSCCLSAQSQFSPLAMVQKLDANFIDGTQFAIAIIDVDTIKYYGLCIREGKYHTIINKDSVFEIGSITKLFTSNLLAQAILDKKVKAQQPLKKFLPFKIKRSPKITLEQLANHTSGLPRLPDNILPLIAKQMNNPYVLYDEALLKTFFTQEMNLNIKTKPTFQYSNLGAGVLGYALSKVYKTPYEQLIKKRIFEPFQLKNSYTNAQQVPKERLVKGLNAQGETIPNWDWDVLAPTGCILSSTKDLSLFVKANLEATRPSLMRQQEVSFVQDEQLSIALGWLVLTKEKEEYYFHNGATAGYTASIALNKQQQKGVVVLSNVSGLSLQSAFVDQLTFSILEMY